MEAQPCSSHEGIQSCVLVSPESSTGGICLGRMSTCSLPSVGQRGGLHGDAQSWKHGCAAPGSPENPAGREGGEMLSREWPLTNNTEQCWRWKWHGVGRLILLWSARSGTEEEAFKPRAFPPNSEWEFHMLLIINAFQQNATPSHSGSWN